MKRFNLVVLVIVFVVFSAYSFSAPEGNQCGVQSDGTVWISKSLLDNANVKIGISAVMVGLDDWYSPVVLESGYYLCRTGKKLIQGEKIEVCFRLADNRRYLPHALLGTVKLGSSVVSNGGGGFNFFLTIK